MVTVLIGNKTDLEENRKVDRDKGKLLAEKYDMIFGEVSSKDGSNIKEIMLKIKQKIYDIIE